MQFTVDVDKNYPIGLTYLAIDDVPQDDMIKAGVIDMIFEGGE